MFLMPYFPSAALYCVEIMLGNLDLLETTCFGFTTHETQQTSADSLLVDRTNRDCALWPLTIVVDFCLLSIIIILIFNYPPLHNNYCKGSPVICYARTNFVMFPRQFVVIILYSVSSVVVRCLPLS